MLIGMLMESIMFMEGISWVREFWMSIAEVLLVERICVEYMVHDGRKDDI